VCGVADRLEPGKIEKPGRAGGTKASKDVAVCAKSKLGGKGGGDWSGYREARGLYYTGKGRKRSRKSKCQKPTRRISPKRRERGGRDQTVSYS